MATLEEVKPLRVAATADIHSPKYLDLLKEAVKRVEQSPDLLLIAGDVIDRGRVRAFGPALEILGSMNALRTVAIFGNEEYDEVQGEIVERFSDSVMFLNDETTTIELKGFGVGIVGTRGSLERPTTWQSKNVPGIRETYSQRLDKVASLLRALKADFRILLMHYSPTFKTLIGEYRRIWPFLGHSGFEDVIEEVKPDVVLHAHAHGGSKRALVFGVEVINVSLPLWGEIVQLNLPRRFGLEGFF